VTSTAVSGRRGSIRVAYSAQVLTQLLKAAMNSANSLSPAALQNAIQKAAAALGYGNIPTPVVNAILDAQCIGNNCNIGGIYYNDSSSDTWLWILIGCLAGFVVLVVLVVLFVVYRSMSSASASTNSKLGTASQIGSRASGSAVLDVEMTAHMEVEDDDLEMRPMAIHESEVQLNINPSVAGEVEGSAVQGRVGESNSLDGGDQKVYI